MINVAIGPEAAESTSGKVDRAAYLTQLLTLRSPLRDAPNWWVMLRESASLRVQEREIPSSRDEEWRFTNLTRLLATSFEAVAEVPVSSESVVPSLTEASLRLVFVNGVYAPELSATDDRPARLFIGTLNQAIAAGLEVATYLGQQAGGEETFTLLNTASFSDAAVIWLDKNQVVETPIHVLFLGSGPIATAPRTLVMAERSSCLTLVEEWVSLDQTSHFSNAVSELWLGENAEVNHTRLQRQNSTAFHIGKTAVSQARDSRYTCTAVSLGSHLSRHNLEVYQTGEQTETTLHGLTLIGGEQIADTHSTIALTRPYGHSQQVHKCIVDDRAHAIFNGRVIVPQAAQNTDAGQLSRTLLLSPKARVDTKPQLEIVADNVKCSHGATVGELENDEIFYLQSRGIDAELARKLLIYAFAHEVLAHIPVPSLRSTLVDVVRHHQ